MAVQRLNGFSGFDVDSTVQKLMQARRVPLDKLKQERDRLEWQRDDYRTLNTKLFELYNKAFDMKISTPYQAKKASSNNEEIVKAVATTNASEGTHTIKITHLAKGSSASSNATVGAGTDGLNKKLGGDSGLGLASNTKLTILGEKGTATIDVSTTDSIAAFVSNFNGKSSKTGVKIAYEESLDKFIMSSTTTGSQATAQLKSSSATLLDTVLDFTVAPTNVGIATGTKTFKAGIYDLVNKNLTEPQKFTVSYNGKSATVEISKSTTLSDVINKINSSDVGKEGVNVYLNDGKQLVIQKPSMATGLTLSNDADNSEDILTDLGMVASPTFNSIAYEMVTGTGERNAEVTFDGVTTNDITSNSFTLGGIQFDAINEDAAKTINVTVSRDVDTIFNNIKSFVEKYNETLDLVNQELSEKRNRNYNPLTDEQKKDMEPEDIKLWEAKAKEGLIRNDASLRSAITNIRLGMGSSVSGLGDGILKQLDEIGIKTSGYKEKGKLHIDEAVLREAITNKPDEVMDLFIANDGDDTKNSGDGIATRLYSMAYEAYTDVKSKAGSSDSLLTDYNIGKSLVDINKRITDYEDRLTRYEDRYYQQFTAMEKALSKYNSQSAYLQQTFTS